MEMARYDDGVPSWVDVQSPDLEKSRAFYAALLGWEVPPGPEEAGGYSIATLRGKNVAGVGPQMNPAAPPAWMTYVNVADADATVAKVTANGGQVFAGPMDVLEAGRMAVFADPAGAVLGLWQPNEHLGAQLVNEPGTWTWSELTTTDTAGAKAFYAAVFGWDEETHPMGEGAGMDNYTEWKLEGRSIGGMMQKPDNVPAEVPPFWMVYFAVDDADATVARVTELGGTVMMPPMDIEPGRFAVATDPTGAVFAVMAMKGVPAS